MARLIADIQKQQTDAIAADPILSAALTSKSKRAVWLSWSFIIASAIAFFEQILDVFSSETEATVNRGAPSTAAWIQDKMLKFQYSATDPQTVQLIDFAVSYPVIDETLRIITRCSVSSSLSGSVIVKVAKNDPPEALTSDELAAAQSYMNLQGTAGITYAVRSSSPDKLMIQAIVNYSGLYSSKIKENVILALNSYLTNLSFDGRVKVSDIEKTILGVVGVTDVTLTNVVAHASATALSDGTNIVLDNKTVGRFWQTIAGYIVAEDESGSTFADTLTFDSE